MDKNKRFGKYLKKVRDNVSNLHGRFYVWKTLQNNEYNDIYKQHPYFWGSVLYSLDRVFLLDLAKLFEQRSPKMEKLHGKGISLYFLMGFIQDKSERLSIEEKIQNHYKTIDAIGGFRNKVIAHEDVSFLLNKATFYKEHTLTYEAIEDLIKLSKEILGDINSAVSGVGHSYSFQTFRESSISDVKSIMGALSRTEGGR